MQPFAYYALSASILTSALGAVILCVIALKDGFASASEESNEHTLRRHALMRVGHAASAVCFALTAGLIVVAVVVQSRGAMASIPAAAVSDLGRDVQQLGTRAATLTSEVGAVDERVRTTETAIAQFRAEQGHREAEYRQLRADWRQATAKLAELERVTRAQASARTPDMRARGESARGDAVAKAAPRSAPTPASSRAATEIIPLQAPAARVPQQPVPEPLLVRPVAPRPIVGPAPVPDHTVERRPEPPTEAAFIVPAPVAPEPAQPAPPSPPADDSASAERSDRGNAIARLGDEIVDTFGRVGRGLRRLIPRI